MAVQPHWQNGCQRCAKLVKHYASLRNRPRDCPRARLQALQAQDAGIADVRGLGSMLAVEFRLPGSGEPDAQRVAAVVRHAQEQGLLLLTCGLYGNAIRE